MLARWLRPIAANRPFRQARRPRLDPLEDRAVPAAFNLGSTGAEAADAVAADAAGNIYVAGTFNGTVDFDPGPGITNLTNSGTADAFLAKYSAAGALLWAGQLVDSTVNALTVDPGGGVYVAGGFPGTTDFDLGPGTSNLTAGANGSGYLVKYNADRSLGWAKAFGGQTSGVLGLAVARDAAGNVYTAGILSNGSADVDPGPGTVTFTNTGGNGNAYIVKLDPAGTFVWAKPFVSDPTAAASVVPRGMGVDAAQNVYLTGFYVTRVDFDPAPPANQWVHGFDVAFPSGDGFAVKLTAAGDLGYVARFGSSTNREDGNAIAVDAAGNAYVTGQFGGTMTIDATAGDTTLTSAGSSDLYVLKFDPVGGLAWARRVGAAGPDGGYGIALDGAGSLYLTGHYANTVDFDPGPGTHNVTYAGGPTDTFALKLGTDGSFADVWSFGGGGYEFGNGIAFGGGAVSVVGRFQGTADFDPGPGVLNLTSAGGDDAFVVSVPQGPANQPPEAEEGTLTTAEDTAATGTLVATDPEDDPLTFSLVDTSAAHGTVTLTDPTTGAYSYTPNADHNGPASFTFKATAGGADSNVATVSITVTPVNDAPTFAVGADQAIDEGAGPQTVTGWATGLSAGPPDEAGQGLSFQVTTDNDALFSVLPTVAPDGTLTYTPAAAAFGTATVTVTLSDDGGTANGGIDTSAPQTFTLTVTAVNDAPVLTGDAELTPVPRNSSDPAGDAVGEFAGPDITDSDGPPEGIAVIGSTGMAAQGAWEFSTDGGQSWSPLGTPSTGAARLLRDTDRVRFVPAPGFVGTVTLTYHAWDQSTGTAGETADLTGGVGGTTAFSTATATGTLQVGVTLTPVAEDTKSPKGDKVAALLTTFVTDPDLKAKSGIAVVGVVNGAAGAWQYSVNGGASWKALAASPNKAVLLRSTDKLRFLPAANATGFGFIRYHAWDQTAGKAGTTIDLTTGAAATGGGTAFSTARGVGFVEVTAVNDAPVLDVGGEPPLTRVPPTATDPAGDLVRDLVGPAATDAEFGPVGIAVTAAAGKGMWQVRLDGSADWVDLGPVTPKTPKFLYPLDRVRFVPTGGILGSAKLKFKAWDGALVSKAVETGTLLVTIDPAPPANTAPVLDPTPTPALLAVLEDTKSPFGDVVLSLLGQAVTDPDPLALRGIAVTGRTGPANGTWQYSTNNGKSWKPVGSVSEASALLLRDLDKLRFLPGKDYNGTATVTYRAWDRTRGIAGARADVRVSGGTTPFSAEPETASAAVNAVNDAPVLNTKPSPQLTPVLPTETDPPGDPVSSLIGTNATDAEGDPVGIAVTVATGPGVWQYREAGSPDWTGITFVAPTFPTFLAPAARIRFLPAAGVSGTAKLAYQAWDGALTSTATESVSLIVNGIDDKPVLNTAGSPALTPVAVNATAPTGDLVSAILGSAATDADPGADLGIAVTGAATTAGTWEVMTNGTTWEALGPVSAKAPRRLKATDRIRFVPTAGFAGSVKLSFKAWDTGSADPNGPLALSAATETAVAVVNTAPVLQA